MKISILFLRSELSRLFIIILLIIKNSFPKLKSFCKPVASCIFFYFLSNENNSQLEILLIFDF